MFFSGLWALLVGISVPVWAADTYRLEEPVDDARIFGVGTRVDVTGKVQPDRTKQPLPLSASVALSYRERRLLGPGSEAEAFRAVREYEQTQSSGDVDGHKSSSSLPDSLKLIVAQGRVEGVELFSLGGLMTSDELELIRSPADSLALIALLPPQPVELGAKWTARPWAFQMLTRLDAVVKGELTCTLASVENQVARVSVAGKIEGAALAQLSEITLSGSFDYDLNLRCISACDMTQVEKRSGGVANPAFDLTARIRLLRRPAPTPGRLEDAKLVEAAAAPTRPAALRLRFTSPWSIGIEHPRYWYPTHLQEKVAIFRLIEEGNLIAQCNLTPLPPARPGEHLSEADFLRDIHQSYGPQLKSISPGEVIPAQDGRYIYRVQAKGSEAADAAVGATWNFYLITDPSGRQASLTTIVSDDLLDELGNRDRELVDSLRFSAVPAGPSPRTTSR